MTAFKPQIAWFDTFLFQVRDKIYGPYMGWRILPVPVLTGAQRNGAGDAALGGGATPACQHLGVWQCLL